MNIVKGKTYKTVNGGSVRIIADDRNSYNGKHWVGLYDGANGEWILTFDSEGTAYVFDDVKPELSIRKDVKRWWILAFTFDGNVYAKIWDANIKSKTDLEQYIAKRGLKNSVVTFLEEK